MAITMFQDANSAITRAITSATDGLQSEYVTGLVEIAGAGMTVYLMVYGYMIISGKIQSPISDLVWNVARMSLIMMFVVNAGGLLDAATNAIFGLQSFFSGGDNIWQILDTRTNNVVDLIVQDLSASGIENTLIGILEAIATLPLLLGIFQIAKEIVLSTVTLTFLTVVAPVFIFCLMYGFTKPMFSRWLSAVFANILKVMIISVFSSLAFTIVALATRNVSDTDVATTLVLYVLSGLLAMATASYGSSLADQLAEVSIEAAARGVMGASVSDAQGINGKVLDKVGQKLMGKAIGKEVAKTVGDKAA